MPITIEQEVQTEIEANYPGSEEVKAMENEGAPVIEPRRSFPEPLLSKERWAQIKSACEAGLELPDASKVFQVSYDAIRQRALRENWLHPRKIESLAREKSVAALSQAAGVTENSAKPPETALEAIQTSLEGIYRRTHLGLAKSLEKGICSPAAQNIEVKTVDDLVKVGGLFIKMAGIGGDSAQVNISLIGESRFSGGLVETASLESPVLDMDELE